MHRSGTSLLSSLLARAGVNMGERLLEARPDNPRGFFEDADFVAFHERCLAHRGLTYINPGNKPLTFTDDELAEARAIINARPADAPWGWKDPRTCLFIRSWHELLPDCRYIIAHRGPMAVAASLARRGELTTGADVASALRAWARYCGEILAFLDAQSPPAVVIDADTIFDDPQRICEALEGIGITLSPDDIRATAVASEFARHSHDHHLAALLDAVDPSIREIDARLSHLAGVDQASTDRADNAVSRSLAALSVAAGEHTDSPAAISALLEAALSLVDPRAGDALARARREALSAAERIVGIEMRAFTAGMDAHREVLAERDNARRNHEHALAAEAAAKANYERALAAETRLAESESSAAENYRRALSAEAAAKANYERALAAEEASLKNHERAVRLDGAMEHTRAELAAASQCIISIETAAKANYERALASEESAKANYERALSAERAAKANYERALSAEAASRANYERALAAEASAQRLGDLAREAQREATAAKESQAVSESAVARVAELELAAAEARETARQLDLRAASLGMQLDEARLRLARERETVATSARAAETARHEADRLRQMLAQMEGERNTYRRRWPPYAAKRLAQKAMAKFARPIATSPPPVANFGATARVAILCTGLPADEHTSHVRDALASQSRRAATLILPGDSKDLAGSASASTTKVFNWWSPDVDSLTQGHDLVLLLHPQHYGPGPLCMPLCLEMAAAALAEDPAADAVVFRGQPGPPRTDSPNHLYETDAATIEHWNDEQLAAVARPAALAAAFAEANPGESRSIRDTIIALLRSGRRALIAPRSFPIESPVADAARAAIGDKLPATAKGAIRALYITQWLECGGADKGIVDLLTRLNPDTIQFSLLTTLASSHPWEDRVRAHVREVCHLGDHLPLPAEKRFERFIVEYCRRREIQLVHIMHSFLGYDSLPALKKSLPGIKVIDQCHILEPPDVMEGGHPAYSSRHYKQYFDHRTVTSEWLKSYMMREHAISDRDISVIYTCVDHTHEFNPDRYERGHVRRPLAISDEAVLVVFVGRLYWQKRPWLFARIAHEVQKRRPDLDIHFAMIGPGPERQRIEAMRLELPNPDRFHLVGELAHGAPVFRDADLLLMPSGHEGLAYVSYEAMAMGVPQIFTAVNGQPELITPDTGILIPVDEAQTVEDGTLAVIDLAENADKRAAMARAGRQRIEQHFGVDVLVSKYESLYRRLVHRP